MRESLYCTMESESFMFDQYLSDLHSLTVVSYLPSRFYQYILFLHKKIDFWTPHLIICRDFLV